jgi:hypothetical protein
MEAVSSTAAVANHGFQIKSETLDTPPTEALFLASSTSSSAIINTSNNIVLAYCGTVTKPPVGVTLSSSYNVKITPALTVLIIGPNNSADQREVDLKYVPSNCLRIYPIFSGTNLSALQGAFNNRETDTLLPKLPSLTQLPSNLPP